MKTEAEQLLSNPVERYCQEPHLSITCVSSAVKALAMMEREDTDYIFVLDERKYEAVVTIDSLADTLARFDTPPLKN